MSISPNVSKKDGNMLYRHHNGFSFRKLERDQLPFLLSLKNESWFGTHRISILNSDDQERWFESLDSDSHCPTCLILTAFCGGFPSGLWKLFNIDWQNRRAEVGWDIYKEYRGRGLGKRLVESGVAFCDDVLNLHRLRAEILVTNEASKKCALAAGFELEGVEKEAILKKGKYVDNLMYGIILPK